MKNCFSVNTCPNITFVDNNTTQLSQSKIQESSLLVVLKQVFPRLESQLYENTGSNFSVTEETVNGRVISHRQFYNDSSSNMSNLTQV